MFCGEAQIKIYDSWWMIATPICDLGEYYRQRFNLKNKARIKIQKPKIGQHITIIRREKPLQNKDKWQERDNLSIFFEYDTAFNVGDNHVWLNVFSKEMNDLRLFFGLPEKPEYPLHLTIGYIEEIYNINWLNEQRNKK